MALGLKKKNCTCGSLCKATLHEAPALAPIQPHWSTLSGTAKPIPLEKLSKKKNRQKKKRKKERKKEKGCPLFRSVIIHSPVKTEIHNCLDHLSCRPLEIRAEIHCTTERTSVLTMKPKTATMKMTPKEPVVMAEGRGSVALCCNDE